MTNVEFELAEQFALYTRKHCFVTGKAGTGKTTLLRRLAERTQKNVVVVATTGVAAVNAGGVTIHSMFGLPLTCFVPNDDFVDPNVATNRYRLLREHLRLRKEKLRVLREMDLLIVDEVSMVRCDTLDAIDLVLRTVRRNRQPFGDVQVLLIGDVHQLPPVAKEAEWSLLKTYYRSPYFFDSLVWRELNAAQIELQTIYRQSDARFLTLLNNVRNRKLHADDYRRLQERYDPAFKPPEPGYVRLTTHNRQADSVNSSELTNLPGRTHSFAAQIEGEFPEALFPCDEALHVTCHHATRILGCNTSTRSRKCRAGAQRSQPVFLSRHERSGNVTFVIHALVQYANDINSARAVAVKQDMRATAVLSITGSHRRAFLPERGAVSDFRNRLPELPDVSLRLIEPPAIRRVIPDLFEIGLGARREDKSALHRAFGFCFRLRAMNFSKSKGVDAPLCSPSTSAARSAPICASRSSSRRRAARMTSLALLKRPSFTCPSTKLVKCSPKLKDVTLPMYEPPQLMY